MPVLVKTLLNYFAHILNFLLAQFFVQRALIVTFLYTHPRYFVKINCPYFLPYLPIYFFFHILNRIKMYLAFEKHTLTYCLYIY
jgi:hypothetical protein